MTTTESRRGLVALIVAHCAGMIDLIALPIWVGALIGRFKFDQQQAGGLVGLFLTGAAFSSLVFAPRFTRLYTRATAAIGFVLSAIAFALSTRSTSFEMLAILHFSGGLASGMALSVTHGAIGRAANPHRTFAYAGLALGIFGIAFSGAAPAIVATYGGPSLFITLSAIMSVAALAALAFFPNPTRHIASDDAAHGAKLPPFGRSVWLLIAGTELMALAQGMTMSFFERVGYARGFDLETVTIALVVFGIFCVPPAPIAAFLEKRISATTVVSIAPPLQAVWSVIAMHTATPLFYAVAGGGMAFTIIFVHTYCFGLLARIEPTGRAVAGTPAMLMVDAAASPFISGTLVKFYNFEMISYVVTGIVILELIVFNAVRLSLRKTLVRTGNAMSQMAAE
ncbi:putative MFS family arabinose efflux permease [Bradyrhizobium embrapense]